MLIEFKVANYRSFRETQTLSLVASNSDELPENRIDRELRGMSGLNYLKSVALYGANASGKSNVLKAFVYLTAFIIYSVNKGPNDPTFAQPFKLETTYHNQPSCFEITFVADGVRYLFSLSLTKERVITESLVAYPNGSPQQWYRRTWNQQTGKYVWKFSGDFKKGRGSLEEKTRHNAAFLSTAVQFNHPQLKLVYDWFICNRDVFFEEGFSSPPSDTAEMMSKSPEDHSLILKLLKNADLGIVTAHIKEKETRIQDWTYESFDIELLHQGHGEHLATMDFEKEESEGTQKYFSILGKWLEAFRSGKVLIVDEIETSLHPMLVWELLKLYNSKEHNPNGAQLIFTTHNPYLLDSTLFRRDQIWFTEKNAEGATQLYPLTDFSPRKDEALTKGYLAGRYGAVPFIPEGLLK